MFRQSCVMQTTVLLSLKRNFRKFNLRNFLLFYKSLVHPLLEHNASVWFLLYVMGKFRIEKVQRRTSRMIPYLQHLPYKKRLLRLGTPSLNFTKRRGDLINVFRIIKHIDGLYFDSFFEYSHYHTTRQHLYKLYPPKSNKKIGQCSFSSGIVLPWNSIPVDVVEAGNV